MVSTLQTNSNKQADVDRLASLKAGHDYKRHHCESGLSHNAHANARAGMGNKRANNSLNAANHSVVEAIPNRIALGATRHNGPELGENC